KRSAPIWVGNAAISLASTACSVPPEMPSPAGLWRHRSGRPYQRIAGASPSAAQHFARLDRKPNADQAECRPQALSGRGSPRRPRITKWSYILGGNQKSVEAVDKIRGCI